MPNDSVKYSQFAGKLFETTVGRILLNDILPVDYPFINKEINRSKFAGIIDDLITSHGIAAIPDILDKVKNFGFLLRYIFRNYVGFG